MLSLGQTREQTKRLRLFVEEEEEEEEEVYSCLYHEPVMLKEIEILPEGRSYLLSLSQTR